MYFQIIDKIKGGFWIFLLLAIGMSLVANLLGAISIVLAIFFMFILIAVMLVIAIYHNPLYAVLINWFSTVLLFFLFYRILGIKSIPLGFVLEGLNFLALFVLLFKQKLSGYDKYLGILLLFWILLCFIELFNPFAASRAAWFHAMRQVLNNIIPFFVIYSLLLSNKNALKYLLTIWVVLITIAAVYTLVQEFGGYPSWDYNYLAADENAMSLVSTFGRMRKISVFSGPMENGVVLAFNSVICLGLAFQNGLKRKYRYSLLGLSLLSAWAMIYTGTRTATVMFVFGAAVYIVLSRRKELLIYTTIFVFLIMAYISVTGGGQALYVMTTAFNPDEDPSMQVRFNNQLKLRGYLMRSPIGYGLGSTGYLGMKYSQHTFLGSFPPDSELVRVVIETGMIGLGFWLFINFAAIQRASNSLLVKGGEFSDNFKMVVTSVLFMFLLGQYPQEILNIGSLKILFALCLAYVSLSQEQMKLSSLYE